MSRLRRSWLCVETRILGPQETSRVVSRHWTRKRALAATKLYAESWRNIIGEVKGGRARWDDASGQVRRFTHGIRPAPAARMAELARLPWVSYFPVPLEDAGDIHGR